MRLALLLVILLFPTLIYCQLESNIIFISSEGMDVQVNSVSVLGDNQESIDISSCIPTGALIPDMNCVVDSYPEIENFTIVADKADNFLNGVSTLDIVLINRHIVTSDKLDFSNLIPADINQDNKINVLDFIELRRLILGIDPNIPAGSWRFLKEEIAEESDLFETDNFALTFNRSEFPIDNIRVLVLKSGDVNNSAF